MGTSACPLTRAKVQPCISYPTKIPSVSSRTNSAVVPFVIKTLKSEMTGIPSNTICIRFVFFVPLCVHIFFSFLIRILSHKIKTLSCVFFALASSQFMFMSHHCSSHIVHTSSVTFLIFLLNDLFPHHESFCFEFVPFSKPVALCCVFGENMQIFPMCVKSYTNNKNQITVYRVLYVDVFLSYMPDAHVFFQMKYLLKNMNMILI